MRDKHFARLDGDLIGRMGPRFVQRRRVAVRGDRPSAREVEAYRATQKRPASPSTARQAQP